MAAVGFIISLGLNTPLYSVLTSVLFIYNGLRAPARASILVFLALAGLVAFGWARLEPALKRWAPVATVAVAVALLAEYATVQADWYVADPQPPEVYQWLAGQPRSVVLELPLTTPDRLDLVPDGIYMFRSTTHWQPILNGYSGFFPKSFMELTEQHEDLSGRDVDCVPQGTAGRPGRGPRRPDAARRVWGDGRDADDPARFRGHGPV